MARIIAISNQKGGVGKTTTTLNLGAYLAKAGKRVLLVDADPQGNTSSGLGLDKRAISRSVYEVLLGEEGIERILYSARIKGLYLAPSLPSLAAAEIELVDLPDREFRLKQALAPIRAYYDYILIDCPPSLGLLTVNALSAATDLLVPVQAEYYALEGLGQLTDTVERVRSKLNPGLNLLGLLLTMDSRTVLSREIASELEIHFPGQVFSSVIPRNIKLAESPSFGKTILEYDGFSKGARSYRSLAQEILRHA